MLSLKSIASCYTPSRDNKCIGVLYSKSGVYVVVIKLKCVTLLQFPGHVIHVRLLDKNFFEILRLNVKLQFPYKCDVGADLSIE